MTARTPLCFVLMPFGVKPDPAGRPPIDFDRIFEHAIRPGIEDAGLLPIRGDEEKIGGIVHKPMFERLLLCEFAVADLTNANANVFYELGIRHAAKPRTTLAVFASHQTIPFDVTMVRALPYDAGKENQFSETEAAALRKNLATRLGELREQHAKGRSVDSPLFQLLGDWKPGEIEHLKTDTFRDQVEIQESLKARISRARAAGEKGVAELEALEKELGALDAQEAGVLVDLFLSYRALGAWDHMISLHGRLPATLRHQILLREQLAFALNRRAGKTGDGQDRQEALRLLQEVESERGPSPETCGLIGRIYKDLWKESREARPRVARAHLTSAIEAYQRGFEADWRDAYPGINAVTLLDIRGDDKSLAERDRLLPVVRYSVERRLESKTPDYWDFATMLELAVLGSDAERADHFLDRALAAVSESWQPATTADNLVEIRNARAARDEDVRWIDEIVSELRLPT